MEQKLTAQIAHAYSGAKVLNKESGYCFEMVAISDSYILVYQPTSSGDESGDGGDELEWKLSYCQPILTRLSNITNEDAALIAGTAGEDSTNAGNIIYSEIVGPYLVLNFENWVYRLYLSVEIIDFLRASSWNGVEKPVYDCGYGSIPSLIDAGIAIENNSKK